MARKKALDIDKLESEAAALQEKANAAKSKVRAAKQQLREENKQKDIQSKILFSETLIRMILGEEARGKITHLDINKTLTVLQLAVDLTQGADSNKTAAAIKMLMKDELVDPEATPTTQNELIRDLGSKFSNGDNPFNAKAAKAISKAD